MATAAAPAGRRARRARIRPWRRQEEERLRRYVEQHGPSNWKAAAAAVGDRTAVQCLHKWTKCLDPKIRHGPWSDSEDADLRRLAALHCGKRRWCAVSAALNGTRTSKQCRERYINYLEGGAAAVAPWSRLDYARMLRLHRQHGPAWACISRVMRRPENVIKNKYHSLLRVHDADRVRGLLRVAKILAPMTVVAEAPELFAQWL